MRNFAVLLAALTLVGVPATSAFAQYGGAAEVEASDTTPAPGQAIVVSGSGFTPGAQGNVLFGQEVLGVFVVADDGTYSTSVTIPADAPCGDTALSIATDAGDSASLPLTIACADAGSGDTGGTGGGGGGGGAAADGEGLAATGGRFTVGAGLVVALVLAGALALFVTRRRTDADA